MADTKPRVWIVFNVLRYFLRDTEDKTMIFQQIKTIIGKAFGRYDPRTTESYIECMTDNNWITPIGGGFLQSRRNRKYTINPEATYENVEFTEYIKKANEHYSNPPKTPPNKNNTQREGYTHTDT